MALFGTSRLSNFMKSTFLHFYSEEDFILILLHYFFWFDIFLESRAEILEKISLVFWKIWRHQKDILKLNDL